MKPGRAHPRKKPKWQLRLYVADNTPHCLLAIANLQFLCERYLKEGYAVRIVDIVKDPAAAIRNDILATPTLIREHPTPRKTVVGCLSDPQAVLRGLDLSFQDGDGDYAALRAIASVQQVGSA